MNRTEFEAIRGIPEKVIREDIRFSRRQATLPALIAEGIVIENTGGVDLRLNITFNPEVGSKTFNVHVPASAQSVDSTSTARRTGQRGAVTSMRFIPSAVRIATFPTR